VSIKILVIDDEYSLRSPLYDTLLDKTRLMEDVKWVSADNASTIQELAPSVDLIFLDIYLDPNASKPFYLPKEDTDVLNLLNEKCPTTPIIVVSNRWGEDQLAKYKQSLINEQVVGSIDLTRLDGDTVDRYRVEIERAVVRNRGGVNMQLGPDDPIHFLHMSDLQFGGKWSDGDSLDEHVHTGTVNRISNLTYRLSNKLSWPTPTALIVTGDIAQHGRLNQYEAAHHFFTKLTAKYIISKRACFFCPGNHDLYMPACCASYLTYVPAAPEKDVNDSQLDTDPTIASKDIDAGDLINPGLVNFRQFVSDFTGKDEWGYKFKQMSDPDGIIFFSSSVLAHHGVSLWGLNTENNINRAPHEFKKGNVLDKYARIFSSHMHEQSERYDNNLNIVFSHHPVIRDGENNNIYLSLPCTTNNLVLFGHRHNDFSCPVKGKDEDLPSYIYNCAPTLTLEETARDRDTTRGFCSILIKRKEHIPYEIQIARHDFKRTKDETKVFKPISLPLTK